MLVCWMILDLVCTYVGQVFILTWRVCTYRNITADSEIEHCRPCLVSFPIIFPANLCLIKNFCLRLNFLIDSSVWDMMLTWPDITMEIYCNNFSNIQAANFHWSRDKILFLMRFLLSLEFLWVFSLYIGDRNGGLNYYRIYLLVFYFRNISCFDGHRSNLELRTGFLICSCILIPTLICLFTFRLNIWSMSDVHSIMEEDVCRSVLFVPDKMIAITEGHILGSTWSMFILNDTEWEL
jgi:hypothetical protein